MCISENRDINNITLGAQEFQRLDKNILFYFYYELFYGPAYEPSENLLCYHFNLIWDPLLCTILSKFS